MSCEAVEDLAGALGPYKRLGSASRSRSSRAGSAAHCSLVAPVSSGLSELKLHPVRTDRTRHQHTSCHGPDRSPEALAGGFLLTCPAGHLDDFSWVEFSRRLQLCTAPSLKLRELGVSGRAAKVQVRCRTRVAQRRMSDAFGEFEESPDG